MTGPEAAPEQQLDDGEVDVGTTAELGGVGLRAVNQPEVEEVTEGPLGMQITLGHIFGDVKNLRLTTRYAAGIADLVVDMVGQDSRLHPWREILRRRFQHQSYVDIAEDFEMNPTSLQAAISAYLKPLKTKFTQQGARSLLIERIEVIDASPQAQKKPLPASSPVEKAPSAPPHLRLAYDSLLNTDDFEQKLPKEVAKLPEDFEAAAALAEALALTDNEKLALQQFISTDQPSGARRPHYEVLQVVEKLRQYIKETYGDPNSPKLHMNQMHRVAIHRTLAWYVQGGRTVFRDPVYVHDYVRHNGVIDYRKEQAVVAAYDQLAALSLKEK